MKYAWSIAGSDSGAQAGVQADIKTMHSLGVHCCSAITAVTAQNPSEVRKVEYCSKDTFAEQISALSAHYTPSAIKTGLLGSEFQINHVAEFLCTSKAFVVCDPVCSSTSGHIFLEERAKQAYENRLFPQVDLLTPNLLEAEFFSGTTDPRKAAQYFLEKGVRSVLIKGGHAPDDFAHDFWTDGSQEAWISSPRQAIASTHGTGCTLSAAITAEKAKSRETLDAIVVAKAYLNRSLRKSESGILHHNTWPVSSKDFPWVSSIPTKPKKPFAKCESIGFYPIVDRVHWVRDLAKWGVSTIQLRIKELHGEELEREIKETIEFCHKEQIKLFVNDHWEIALRHGAYGVHLGQEDIQSAPIEELQKAGIRLGVSTHSYAELATAIALSPSYIALGPIFPTTCKSMRFGPQGIPMVKVWKDLIDVPLVAIGGITIDDADNIIEAGADGVAVISAITKSEDPETETHAWLEKERKLNRGRRQD